MRKNEYNITASNSTVVLVPITSPPITVRPLLIKLVFIRKPLKILIKSFSPIKACKGPFKNDVTAKLSPFVTNLVEPPSPIVIGPNGDKFFY